MEGSKSTLRNAFYGIGIAFVILAFSILCYEYCTHHLHIPLNLQLDVYEDQQIVEMWNQLVHRVTIQPFNLVAFVIFLCAVFHTFFAHRITVLAYQLRDQNIQQGKAIIDSFGVEFLKFMGEVEVIFGFWVIPLMLAMTYFYNWDTAVAYLESQSYTEPLFVVVIMILAASRPIIKLAEGMLHFVAKLGGSSPSAWWWTILTIGPLSGSFITEPGAMTIAAVLLSHHFFSLKPTSSLAYSTLGLLFVNISVGGVFTNFAAPPVLMVARPWHWSSWDMLTKFGCKAFLGILIANTYVYLRYRKEFQDLEKKEKEPVHMQQGRENNKHPVPVWVTLIHCMTLVWVVLHVHNPVIFIGTFLLFIGFHRATLPYQTAIEMKTPILVGFFLAGLVVHGGLQGWWISSLLSHASHEMLLGLSLFLTSFNDNAAITYLASLTPNIDEAMKYAIMAGAVSGGGLTVIANAPNPSGQAILNRFFDKGIGAVGLLKGALVPTAIVTLCFYLFR